MLKLAKISFATGVFMLLISCKAVESAQKETGSSYELVIKLQDVSSYADVISGANNIKSPADIQVIVNDNYFMYQISEIRIRYNDATDNVIQMIRNEFYRCRGILELSICRL